MTEGCFHCDEALPTGLDLRIRVQGEEQSVCCFGCQAVAQLIIDSGQSDYYRFREQPAAPVDQRLLDQLEDWKAFESMAGEIGADGLRYADVLVEGIRCSACGWLIENQLMAIDGVERVQVDIVGRDVRIGWDPLRSSFNVPLQSLVRLGFRPHPGSADQRRALDQSERRSAIMRLGVAGLAMMQVMMVAGGTWFAEPGSIDPLIHRYLDLVAMLVATPVVLYSGAPFFNGALRALSVGRVNVDVPVSLALTLAYGASCRNLLAGSGAVYFDSVSMFVFFLLLGRLVEMNVRQRSLSLRDASARMLPDIALLMHDGGLRSVPRDSLKPGDRVTVRHGEAFPADGQIESGSTRVDESLMTGEARPVVRQTRDPVLAGSINLGPPIVVTVAVVGDDLVVSRLQHMLVAARGQRPPVARQADRLARYLVAGIVLTAVVTWGLWLPHDPEQAFQSMLAVLVVTCPCALSLATPSALAAATVQMSRQGLLVFGGDAVTTLGQVDRVVFDKTGTLTMGQPRAHIDWLRDGENPDTVMAECAALERGASHPVATALRSHDVGLAVSGIQVEAGGGVSGLVNGRKMAIGSVDFIERVSGLSPVPGLADRSTLVGTVWVVRDDRLLAAIGFEDALRRDARETVMALADLGAEASILSGDQQSRVERAAMLTGIRAWSASQTPAQKLERVRQRQSVGETVLVVGDGVNDGPVLAGGDVSVALGSGSGLAQGGADLLLSGEDLGPLVAGVTIGRFTCQVIRQNLIWALGYNLCAVPLAALGFITPWMAALGMSASSLVVVLNAARIARRRPSPLTRELAASR